MKRSLVAFGKLIPVLGLVVCALFALSSCATVATDQDIMRLNDQILLVSNRVDALQASVNKQKNSLSQQLSGDLNTRLSSIHDTQAEVVAEIERIKQDMDTLSGRVDENGRLAKHAIERDTTQEDDLKTAIAELSGRVQALEKNVKKINAYLDLSRAARQKPAGATGGKEANLTPPPAKEKQVTPEQAMYEKGLGLYKDGKFEQAIADFRNFIKTYPQSDLTDNAQFWIGECYMGLKKYEEAILSYQQVIKRYPKGNKVPNAMLRQALAFHAINDNTSAKLLLEKIIRSFPKSNEANIAKLKLKELR